MSNLQETNTGLDPKLKEKQGEAIQPGNQVAPADAGKGQSKGEVPLDNVKQQQGVGEMAGKHPASK